MDLEKGLVVAANSPNAIADQSPMPSPTAASTPRKTLVLSNSGKALVVSNSSKSLGGSNSGKRIDQVGKKKYVKQVTGRHNDTELHLAAKRGDLDAVRQILSDIDAQMTGTLSGADFDAEVDFLPYTCFLFSLCSISRLRKKKRRR